MAHEVTLITTLAAALGTALVFGFLAARLKLPPLLGYLVAGVLIGPATPGFVADVHLSQQLAEIGVILLMFGVGLHFSLDDLLSVRMIALPGAVVQIAAATLLGFFVARFWGWSTSSAIVFGLSFVGGQHGGAAARTRRSRRTGDDQREDRHRMAHR